MRKIITIGEALIDFIPEQIGVGLDQVQRFMKAPGGAPANVAASAAKLGANAYFMGMVGNDGFGTFLNKTLKDVGVDVSRMKQTSKAHTALAFVSLKENGDRDFIFYRDPSADQLMEPIDLDRSILDESILHFCSVSLKDYPIKETHLEAIAYTKKHGGIISFDPNVRLPLWEDHQAYQKVIRTFIPFADILKISDDELSFITGFRKEEDALAYLKSFKIRYIIITRGKSGVTLYTRNKRYDAPGFKVTPVDTTGAGDSWIGTFLSLLATNELTEDNEEKHLPIYLRYANAAAALTTTKYGAISALPSQKEIDDFMEAIEHANGLVFPK